MEHRPVSRLVVMGVCGCGKSEIGRRLAARLHYGYIEGDDFHPPENIQKMTAGTPLTDADRSGWLLVLKDKIAEAARNDRGMVLACSALKRAYRDILRAGDPDLIFIHLRGDPALIERRMRERTRHFMPLGLIESQFRDLMPLKADEKGIEVTIDQEPERIVDHVMATLQAHAQA